MVILISAVAIAVLLVTLIKVVKTCVDVLNEVIRDFRLERELLGLQKQIVSQINTQISLQKIIMEEQLTMAMNGLTAMKLLHDREQDPHWVAKFEEGRSNARFN